MSMVFGEIEKQVGRDAVTRAEKRADRRTKRQVLRLTNL